MRDFPQELVDQVIDELFALVGRDNCYGGPEEWFESDGIAHCAARPVPGISDYSLVSKAWVGPTQKYHFCSLPLDYPAILEKWRTRIAPDPAGVSRHVRMLVLRYCQSPDFEGFEGHMHAFTRVKRMDITDCDLLRFPSITQWFLPMGSCLAWLAVNNAQATPHTVTSLLAALPLLQNMEIFDFKIPDDTLANDHPEGSLGLLHASAGFGRLVVHTAHSLHNPGLLDQWLTSFCATLTVLSIREKEGAFIPMSLGLSQFSALECLRIPASPLATTVLRRVTSSRLAIVTLDLVRENSWDAATVDGSFWEEIEEYLCPLAKRFKDAHPGKVMRVMIDEFFKNRGTDQESVRRTSDYEGFISNLKNEAKVEVYT